MSPGLLLCGMVRNFQRTPNPDINRGMKKIAKAMGIVVFEESS